ncbi:DMT family transporter [Ureibacillus sp. FSL K6-8385]|uniref:DMT family transporter n=1 Tax=Ureibacillus terrenus TaxID=118246 RepID=A0A540V128_9BACL|nr:DMT family transporter [Ureibacillus terrenus]MED3663007.1 DMT family transporter [Ureibacillus terrenus]MED3765084.1 DMT family transporter [Ureibacillus terrenus]TQE90459.1 DMT family transporter [Ureibacillus terrenus]
MWIGAALSTMFCFGTNNMIFKWSTAKGYSKIHIQLYFYLFAFLITATYGLFVRIHHMNLATILLGALIGILNTNGNIQMSKAFEKGPASITSSLISLNTIIPILSAALIFHEHITVLQWTGIFIMLCSAVAIQYKPSSDIHVEYLPWMMRICFAILSLGILGILMKTSTYMHIVPLNMLIAMYGGGAVYLLANSFLVHEKWQQSELKIGAVVGLLSVIAYSCYFFALQKGVASIVFSIVSLSCLVVVCGSSLIFHEKLKMYQILGVITALLGMICTKF